MKIQHECMSVQEIYNWLQKNETISYRFKEMKNSFFDITISLIGEDWSIESKGNHGPYRKVVGKGQTLFRYLRFDQTLIAQAIQNTKSY